MKNNVVLLKDKVNPLIQMNQELESYLYQLTVFYRQTFELQQKVQEVLGIKK